MTNQESPSSYQTISFGAISSADAEQDDNWNPTTFRPEIILQEQKVENEMMDDYSLKPSKFDFDEITSEEFSQQEKNYNIFFGLFSYSIFCGFYFCLLNPIL